MKINFLFTIKEQNMRYFIRITIFWIIFYCMTTSHKNYYPVFKRVVHPFQEITKDYDRKYQDFTYKENIKTVLLHKEGWELSYPIIELNGEVKLKLSFDDFNAYVRNYSYTLIHCDADWRESDLLPSDYIEGFVENQIYNYDYSFNTLHKYIHYYLTIPNEDIQPKLSGNYILKVYENYDENDIVLTKRFAIVDSDVDIYAGVKRPSLASYRNSGQEIDFTIQYNFYQINDPFTEIKVVITQNNRWDNAITDLKPLFIRNNNLIYDYNEENVFPGGSEYRSFDIKSIRYQTEYIKQIYLRKPYYHIELYPDKPKPFKVYFFENELNGKYYIDIQEENNSETDADYVFVHFYLPYDVPLIDGNIFVFGALSDWNFTKINQMVYNYEKKTYELTMLLKQGYYNYEYVFVKEGENKANNILIEGSHYETENDYLIYVYHRDNRFRYDKLIGIKIINSLNPNKDF